MKPKRATPPKRNTKADQAAEREARIVECWLERPKKRRTADDVMPFVSWLSEHEPSLIPDGAGAYARIRALLLPHLLEDGDGHA